MTIVEQLTHIYMDKEFWHKSKLSKEEADKYHERLLMNGNILTYVVKGELQGYLEYYRITYEQFGRICCNFQLDHSEDILNGNISLINRMWINEEFRNGEAFDMLAAMYLTKNKDAELFAAFQEQKKHKQVQVYPRNFVLKHYKRGE